MLSPERRKAITNGVPWNLFLLTTGASISTIALLGIAKPHGFVAGGFFGLSMLLNYIMDSIGIAAWYAMFSIPVLLTGWFFLSRRFMLYTIYGIAVATVITQLFTQYYPLDFGITDKTLAAIATGALCGLGAGIALRSLGSDGGMNVVSLILNQKYNFNVGSVGITFNFLLFMAALPVIKMDNVLYSMIIAYITGSLTNYFLSMFNDRKLVYIISDHYENIAQSIMRNLGRGCTVLHGQGSFTRQEREILLTVVHSIQLKRLEELILTEDPNAFVIIDSTYLVLGKGFSQRKKY